MALSRRTGQRFQASIWPGFVDAMTGLLLVLMFLLTIFMVVQFVLRDTISGQETELDALAGEVSALASALGLEERESSQLEARLGALNSTLNDTQTDLTQAQAQVNSQASLIASLTLERDQQDAALATAETRITGFEAQVAGLLADRDTALGDIAALERQRADLQVAQTDLLTQQEALNLALAQTRTEIDAQTEVARLAAARREALEALIVDLRQSGADSTARADQLAETVAGLEQQLSDEEIARLTESAAAQALREKLAGADVELTAMTLALEAQRQEAEDTLTLLAAADVVREELDKTLAEALARIDTANAAVQDRDELTERLTRVLAQMEVSQSESVRSMNALEAELERIRSEAEIARAELAAQLAIAQDQTAQTRGTLEASLARIRTENATQQDALRAQLANTQTDSANRIAALQADLTRARTDLVAVQAGADTTAQDRASIEARLLQALESLERSQAAAANDQQVLRARLAAALAVRQDTKTSAVELQAQADQQAALLLKARETLSEQAKISAAAQRQTALLNQQVAALRTQLGGLQALLDDSKERDAATNVQLQSLGSDLNAALARTASEERKRRILEEAERKRLEIEAAKHVAEAAALREQAKDLESYRSEFFGQLREVLGGQEGVRIDGDRFIFSSEVLFPPGGADLSPEGQAEIAKVADILRQVAIPPELDWVIRVDGHTDNVPFNGRGKYADNWELSQGRALSVVRFMINQLDISPTRLSANGFGEYQPINTADTPEARAQNRRIELKLTEK